jgi:hypothetical protein
MKTGVRTVLDRTAELRRALATLTSQDVLVGIPADKSARDDDGVTNAQLGYIHETGSPLRNIPARPFLEPGIRAAQDKIVEQLKDAATRALDGDAGGVTAALNRAGIVAQNSVRARFVDNDWPPLSEASLNKRPPAQRDESGRVLKRGKSRRERGALNPLIDTSQLRKSVTYVLRKRGS